VNDKYREIHLYLNDRLSEIADAGILSPVYKLNPDAHVVCGDDDLTEAARVLTHGRLPVVQGPAIHDSPPAPSAPGPLGFVEALEGLVAFAPCIYYRDPTKVWCKVCDSPAGDTPETMPHEDDCPVPAAQRALAAREPETR